MYYTVAMKPTTAKSIRAAGIVITALVIPISILALFLLLQETGSAHQMVLLLYIGWALINFIAIPFILLGFIIRYTIKPVIYLAIAHLTLSLANATLLLTSATVGSMALLATVALPSLLYIIGLITHTKQLQHSKDSNSNIPNDSDTPSPHNNTN